MSEKSLTMLVYFIKATGKQVVDVFMSSHTNTGKRGSYFTQFVYSWLLRLVHKGKARWVLHALGIPVKLQGAV